MADNGFVRGKTYYIKPTHIVAGRQQTFGPGGGGGYSGSNGGWGLQEGPRRGEGGSSGIRDIALPNVMAEFMNEQVYNQQQIDNEYNARFNTLLTDTTRELEERKNAAKSAQVLAPPESAAVDQQVTLELIDLKKKQYISIAPNIYGLFGQSPFFMMEVLPRQKMREFLNSGSADSQALMSLYAMFDNVYKSALELKALSLSVDILAGKLADLANSRNQAESVVPLDGTAWFAVQSQRLSIIGLELNIHAQQLPEFLQTELVAAAGSLTGMTQTQVLLHYKATLERMASTKMAEIKPVVAPPPYKSGGITINFRANNPKISAPLSKPELEALNELVYLQTHTPIGTKWLSYHDALLKAESARHLTSTSNALGGLAERSNEAEQIQSAIKFTTDFYKEVSERFGVRAEALAKELSENAKGKTIRNAGEAIKAFDQYKNILSKKFGVQDREAIARALDALDKEVMSKNLTAFGKGLKTIGNLTDLYSLLAEAQTSSRSGDWIPFFVKVESLVVGKGATALVAFMFGLTAATPMTILGFALLTAVISSLIDDALVGKINDYVINL